MRIALSVAFVICTTFLGPTAGVQASFAATARDAEDMAGQEAPSGQEQEAPPNQEQEAPPSELFSADQLDNLLAPIALYPDPLLAQVLPASTFVDQIDEASRWLRANNDPNSIDEAPWDVSVKAVAHYPAVLYMMADKIDWTTSLGQAYVNQSTDVMSSIQRLRAMAHNAGNLVSNQQQQVIVEGDYIRIDPYQPRYIYVPVYDPYAVYYQGGYGFGPGWGGIGMSFGTGFAIGAWLNYDFDWGGHRIYYHGWQGGGWIGRSRPGMGINNVYVNNNYRNIQINRTVINDNVNYNNLNRYNSVHRQVDYNNVAPRNRGNFGIQGNRGSFGTPGNPGNRGNPNVANRVINHNVNTNDPRIDVYRGRQPIQQPPARGISPSQATPERPGRPVYQPQAGQATRPPTSVFSGNQGGFDPRTASRRGQASRETAGQSRTAAPNQPDRGNQSRPANPPARESSKPSKRGGRQ